MEIITTFDEWQQELDTELTKTAGLIPYRIW